MIESYVVKINKKYHEIQKLLQKFIVLRVCRVLSEKIRINFKPTIHAYKHLKWNSKGNINLKIVYQSQIYLGFVCRCSYESNKFKLKTKTTAIGRSSNPNPNCLRHRQIPIINNDSRTARQAKSKNPWLKIGIN